MGASMWSRAYQATGFGANWANPGNCSIPHPYSTCHDRLVSAISDAYHEGRDCVQRYFYEIELCLRTFEPVTYLDTIGREYLRLLACLTTNSNLNQDR